MLQSRWTHLACLILTLWIFLPGCAVEPDPNTRSGADATKRGAREIPFGRMDTDSVSRTNGDMTDWKYFRVPETGVLEFTLSFDNPDSRGVAIIRNNLGVQRVRLEHRGQPILKATFRGEPGVYYIEVFAQDERTVYTYQVDYEPLY